jgi:pimeloyl-ACP methyl ester carboxylesterase
LTRALDRAWDRFGAELPGLTVPTLAVHGEDDPIAPISGVRAYADEIPTIRVRAFDDARHDILNESVHRQVAAAIVEFIGEQAAA